MTAVQPRIDANVQIFFRSDGDLRDQLREPFRSRGFPHVDVAYFAPLTPRYAAGTETADGSHPGSDPEIVGRAVLDDAGMDLAILHPATAASILPDWHLASAILAATNQMMVDRWLDSGTYADRFRGTIRVNPRDIDGAVREIRRWADHPRVVQIGLPMQTVEPYGRPEYTPLWRAACDANLPIAVHIEKGVGITHPPTPSGVTRTFSHLAAYQPMTFVWHLFNMIAEGVFQQFPDLKVVWADGGADMLTPFIWRFDTFGRPHLEQTPWAPQMPSAYLPGHVHFVSTVLDNPPGDADFAGEWLRMTGKEDMLLYGSSYPSWQLLRPEALPAAWSDEQRVKVMGGNAARLYGISADPSAAASTAAQPADA